MANVIDLAQYRYTLTLDDSEYTKNMASAETSAEKMKTKLNGIGGFLKGALVTGLAAAGAAIAGCVVEGVKSYADLEQQMSSFSATTGASAEEVARVQELAKELYKTNTDSMEDIVATSAAMMTQMGATTEQVEALQQSIMDFAKTTGMSNTDVVSSVDDIGDAWNMTAEESVAYLDVIKKSSEKYGTDVTAVTAALSDTAPAAQALGLELDEVNGMMNLFADSGLDASQSITALTYAAKSVESPEQFKTMLADIQAIEDPTARAQAAVELFGSKAGVALSNAFDNNTSLEDFILTTDECAGAVSDASASFDGNFNTQLELAKKQFSGITMEIGQKLLPVINNILSWVTANLPKIVSTVESAVSFIGDIISPLMSGIKDLIQGVISIVTAIWAQWGDDITSFTKSAFSTISTVISTVVEVIKSVIGAFIALINGDWDGFLSGMKNAAANMWELIKTVFTAALEILKTILSAAFEAMKTAATTIFNALWEGIKSIFDSVKLWFENAWNSIITWFAGLATQFFEAAKKVFTSLWDGLKNIWNNVAQWLNDIWVGETGIITTIIGFGAKIFDAGKSIFTSLWDGLKSVWTSISDWVSAKIEWITDKLAFWRLSSAEMSVPSSVTVDGSHANGLSYVPFDGYTAILHKGERVLTAQENARYNSNKAVASSEGNVTLSIGDIHLSGVQDTDSLAKDIKDRLPTMVLQYIYKR